MPKKKKGKGKKDDFPIGKISAEGYMARVATPEHDGRYKDKTNNLFGR